MNSLTVAAPPTKALPSADNPAPSLACEPLHWRLSAGVAREAAATMGPGDLPALRAYIAEAERVNRPAREEEIAAHVERLRLHYPATANMGETAQALAWEDWFSDLGDVPPDVIEAACVAWRRSDARFAPSPGQLMAKVGGANHWGKARLLYERRARDVLRLIEERAK